jgi:hypothetical protein
MENAIMKNRPIEPFREVIAYEALWGSRGASFKSLSVYYDDRMVQCLKLYCEQQPCDFQELITIGADMVASHSTSNRYSVAEIEANLHLDESLSQNLQPNIALVDEVLTTGAHYKAAERLIKRYFRNKRVCGIFVARRALQQTDK